MIFYINLGIVAFLNLFFWLFKLMIYFIFLYYYSFTQEGSSGTNFFSKIQKFNKRRALNKAIGPGKIPN